ncbi:MAG: outer spore coat protein CotE [Bacilli bacterium]|nr:outer spore coat protein CotE [Bacilli bacterium]
MYREILTKAIVAKGKKEITNKNTITINNQISKVLGCWVINHKYSLQKDNQKIYVKGSYEAFFWYGYDDDTNCGLERKTFEYIDEIPYTFTQEEIIIDDSIIIKEKLNKVPTCTSMIYDQKTMTIEVQLIYEIDIIGETKLKIKVDDVVIDQMINTNYMNEKQ